MFFTIRTTTSFRLLVFILVAYVFAKTVFTVARFLFVQPAVRIAEPKMQQWQELTMVTGKTTSQVFERDLGKSSSEEMLTGPPFLKPHLNSKSVAGLNTSCTDNLLGLTEYASYLCSESSELCSVLSCRSLLSGNKISQIVAQSLMSKRPHLTDSDTSFINATLDCEAFKRRRAYHITPLTDENTSFPLAFSLLVHKSADQLELLLRTIYRPQNVYCIHVDAKAPQSFISAVRAIAGCFENVFVASKLEFVTWAGFSRLQADINCMQDLIKRATPWRYLLNTAGQAFPLKTIAEMVKILQLYNGANDIEGIYGSRVRRERFEWEWVETEGKLKTTGKRKPKPPHNIDIVRGSAYGIFSREFVEYILKDHRATEFLAWSKQTWSPDEHYWATLHHTYSNPHLHAPGAFSGLPNEKPWLAVFAKWHSNECRGKVVRDVCIFGIGDLPDLIRRREFFANKFYADFEPLALQCLSAWIRQKETCPPVFDFKYYSSLPFIKGTMGLSAEVRTL